MSPPNSLIHTTSPYLLQHAYQPIHWRPWEENLATYAQQENKPILLSIGYATCHWCHVMAQESFEDEEVATVMNSYFINIKIDRQENPDIDQAAITATQSMGLEVGWPLHVFLLPNLQPFYGGTYFTKKAWKKLLKSIAQAFILERPKLDNSALNFTKWIQNSNDLSIIPLYKETLSPAILFEKIYQSLDHHYGGMKNTYKFLMPSICSFLLKHYTSYQTTSALAVVKSTLTQAAYGGIYDQLGGGFFRYTTDEAWHIPHFEKMLCDNALIISVYAHAYAVTNQLRYSTVLSETLSFLMRDMYDPEGAFYAAMDADSQGQEGAFYTWTYTELEDILGEDTKDFTHYYNVSIAGNWKEGFNVLYKNTHENIPTLPEVEQRIAVLQQHVYKARLRRPLPALDKQVIASWNGMMLQGLVDAYYVLEDSYWLSIALKNASYLERYLLEGEKLWHSYSHHKKGNIGYLEDYAWVSKGFIALYQATFDPHWLQQADRLVTYTLQNFRKDDEGLYETSQKCQPFLLIKTKEIFDQAVPSSNAILAENLFDLAILLQQPTYQQIADSLLKTIGPLLKTETVYMSHWASLYCKKNKGIPIVSLSGAYQLNWARLIKKYHTDVLVINHDLHASFTSLKNKKPGLTSEKTHAYLCHSSCHGPFDTLEEILQAITDFYQDNTLVAHRRK